MYWQFNVCLPKIYVQAKSKDIHAKTFNMITNKNEGKTMTKYVYVIPNAGSIVQHVIQIKNGMMKHVNVSVKIIVH